jgi:type 1 glutamine amidotransferase
LEAVLGVPPAAPVAEPRRLKILLVAGPQDHGPGEHDYPVWQRSWEKLLGAAQGVRVATATNWPDGGQWSETDLVVCYFWNHDWSEARYRDLDAFLARGGGAVFLHAAMIADRDPESLAGRLGLSAEPKRTRYRHGPLELRAVAPPEHPLTRGFRQARLIDETYWPLIGDPSRVEVLATAVEEEKSWPMLWTYRPGKGRVFCSVLGHYTWTLEDPLFRILILRGMAWAAGEPADRFEPLALGGMEGK